MVDELDMPNWSRIIHGGVEEGPSRVSLLLKDISENLVSEAVFLLAPSGEKPKVWTIPEGWVYPENWVSKDFSISDRTNVIKKALSEEYIVLDPNIGNKMPLFLEKLGVKSAIAAAVGYPEREALLMICNSKKAIGNPPLYYTMKDANFAVVIARVISMDGVGRFIHKKITEVEPMGELQNRDVWSEEKDDLFKTHPGWFVAYQDGKRVAFEPSLDRLVAILNEKLGVPRKPCEFHEIIEQISFRRGPSPRLKPTKS